MPHLEEIEAQRIVDRAIESVTSDLQDLADKCQLRVHCTAFGHRIAVDPKPCVPVLTRIKD